MFTMLNLVVHAGCTGLTRHSLDAGWRFHLGDIAGAADLCPGGADDPFRPLNDTACASWGHANPHGTLSVDECRLACCGDPMCAGWTHSAHSYKTGYGSTCYLGDSPASCVAGGNATGDVGGIRAIPVPPAALPPGSAQSTAFDDSAWRVLDVPHDFVVEQLPGRADAAQQQGSHGYRAKNVSWYRRSFSVPPLAAGEAGAGAVWLEFDGVYRAADVWLNGEHLGHHSSGYVGFRFRLDGLACFRAGRGASNVVAVRVDPRANEGWFYEGGGIYRHVWLLTAAAAAHIAPLGVFAPATLTGAIDRSARGAGGYAVADAEVTVATELEGAHPAADVAAGLVIAAFTVQTVLLGPGGEVAWEGSTPAPADGSAAQQVARLTKASLWEPPSSAQQRVAALYTVVSTLLRDGVAVDSVNTTIGIRRVSHDAARGLLINGAAVKAKGMCNHQDFAGVGTAVPDRLQAFRVRAMAAHGVNAWRMSHNPPNAELLDALDRAGMLVMDETRNFGHHSTWLRDWEDMVRRDRNRASVIWWSVCNEIGCEQATSDVTISAGVAFKAALHALDDTRPMTAGWKGYTVAGAMNMTTETLWTTKVVDVYGKNYGNGDFYDALHNETPATPLLASEHCSCNSDRAAFANASDGILGPSRAWGCLGSCWQPVATRPFVQGLMAWTGFDYRGENTWPETNAQFGMLDLAGFPKDDAYWWQSQFLPDSPTVRLVPGSWEAPPPRTGAPTALVTAACTGLPGQGFDFAELQSPAGAVAMRSRSDPTLCVRYNPVLQRQHWADIGPCVASDPNQHFYWDAPATPKRLVWANASDPGHNKCLDLFGGTGPQIDFFECRRGANQEWTYVAASGALHPTVSGFNGTCVDDSEARPVWVYTNGDRAELFLNGASLGAQDIAPFDKGTWAVPFVPGNLTVLASRGGGAWGSDTKETAGAAATVQLGVDMPSEGDAPLVADGRDIAVLTATVVDAKGRAVTACDVYEDACPEVVVTVENGMLLGMGNGDPKDHTAEGRAAGNARRVFGGVVRVLVQTSKTPGDIVVHATASALKGASVTITAFAAP